MPAFHFFTKLAQTLLLGSCPKSAEELLFGVHSVPDASVYYHTHRFLNQHHFLSLESPNDCANWVTQVLGGAARG